jgi:hypothetical protein
MQRGAIRQQISADGSVRQIRQTSNIVEKIRRNKKS